MSPFPLVIFLTLAAGSDRAIPPGCSSDYESCHEDCTVEYGGVTTKYRLLTQCVDKCLSEQDDCTTRHYSLRGAQIPEPSSRGRAKGSGSSDEFGDTAPAAATPRDGSRRGVYRASDDEAPARPEPAPAREPTRAPAPEPLRTPEPEPEPAPRPAARASAPATKAPAPAREPAAPPPAAARTRTATPPPSSRDEDIPVFGADASKDEPEAAPAPKPKPAPAPSEPLRPTPPAEPKKKDISDWDPNGK